MSEEPKIKIDLEEISKKKQKLEKISAELKKEFIGIDYIIDELINYIQIWYLMPEILYRPIIVNLWGMTGVGKTDLVRKLIAKLEFQDRFAEVELSNSEGGSYYSHKNSVTAILEGNGINDGKPAIVLFDELQRFNTLDTEGKPIQNVKFQDFWELLSDGRLAKRDIKEEVDRYLNNYWMYSEQDRRYKRDHDKRKAAATPEENIDEYTASTVGLWDAQNIKRLFALNEDLPEIADWTQEDLFKKMSNEKTSKKKIYEAIDHSKTLIIISGNLDEAFQMANETGESDVDADIFNAYTRKITLVDIKHALSRKFKPEQVARLGNIHCIYRSLTRKNFEDLISQEIKRVIAKNKELFGVELTISKNLNSLIYKNGVFPVQGVRPVFSSVMDVLESNLSKFLFEAFMNGVTKIDVDYDWKKSELVAKLKGYKTIKQPYVGRIDKIREGNQHEVVSNVSVHESGHAIIYGLLFGLSPLQLKSKVASHYAAGFTFPHQIYQTKRNLINKVKVYLAGGLAEELIFGADNATIGREHDREQATALTLDYLRRYGFDAEFQAFYAGGGPYAMEMNITDKAAESMIKQLVVETQALLSENKAFLLQLSRALQLKGSLTTQETAQIASDFGYTFVVKEETYLHLEDYTSLLKDA